MIDLIKRKKIKKIEWKTQDCDEQSLLFFRLTSKDKLKYLEESIFAHAIVEADPNLVLDNERITIVSKKEFEKYQVLACDYLYPIDMNSFKKVAITGTNGKTTTCDLLRQLALTQKINVLSIGTLGVYFNENKSCDFGLTTPNYIDLRKFIFQHKDLKLLCVEVSSHSLVQNRLHNLSFDVGIWTSFSQDHLDYHKNMDDYFKAKSLLQHKLKDPKNILVSKEDENIHKKLSVKTIVENLHFPKQNFLNVSYNLKNLNLAIKALDILYPGLDFETSSLSPADGRMNFYHVRSNDYVIDYAHTPDAIENVCKALKETHPQKQLVTIFGCGGDRDRSKRPLMGKAACTYSDEVIITADNPRFEEPEQIFNDILEGVEDFSNYTLIKDRKAAILSTKSFKNKVILVAGKGHEAYMDIKGQKNKYSDLEVIESLKE